jgi:nitronate monooxygenase
MTPSWPRTTATERLGIELPIVQAPMSGSTTPELVAAVSAAGGLGSLGAARQAPDDLRRDIHAVRALTDRPFAVNLFVWKDEAPGDPAAVDKVLRPHRERLGLPDPPERPRPPSLEDLARAQREVVRDERVPVVSFAMGVLEGIDAIRVGTATSVADARALEEAGVDLIVAQGAEAGGHRGGFADHGLVGLVALIPQIVDAVSVPVLAAGGIMDGRAIAAALVLGAAGVQLGTAFLACPECAAPPQHKAALRETPDTGTVIAATTGRPARGRRSALVDDLPGPLLPFPDQAARWADLQATGDPDATWYLMGQGSRMAREEPAADVVARLARETADLLA